MFNFKLSLPQNTFSNTFCHKKAGRSKLKTDLSPSRPLGPISVHWVVGGCVRPLGGVVFLATANVSARLSSSDAAHDPNGEYCTQPHAQNHHLHTLSPGPDHDAQGH